MDEPITSDILDILPDIDLIWILMPALMGVRAPSVSSLPCRAAWTVGCRRPGQARGL